MVQIKSIRRRCVPYSASRAPCHIPQRVPSHYEPSSFKQRPHVLTVSPSTSERPIFSSGSPIRNNPRRPYRTVHQGRNFPRTRVPNVTTSGNPKRHSRTSVSITPSPCKAKAQGLPRWGRGSITGFPLSMAAECSILSLEGGLCMRPSKGGTPARQALPSRGYLVPRKLTVL